MASFEAAARKFPLVNGILLGLRRVGGMLDVLTLSEVVRGLYGFLDLVVMEIGGFGVVRALRLLKLDFLLGRSEAGFSSIDFSVVATVDVLVVDGRFR